MSIGDEEPETESEPEWQFSEWTDTAPTGGGLLREILESVRQLQSEMTSLRDALASTNDRVTEALTELSGRIDSLRDREPSAEVTQLVDDLAELRRILIGS
jgi:predicted  nucleic acid-binding Zn-ribbon protein